MLALAPCLPVRGAVEWTFESREPGWTLIAADARMIAETADGGSWVAFGPEQGWLDVAVLRPPVGRHEVAVVRLDEDARRYRLVLDLGPVPVRHRALVATLARPGSVAQASVEGSDDGRTWRELGRGSLVRVGRDERMARDRIDYAPVSVRFLRLSWPRGTAPLEFAHLAVEAVRDAERAPTVAARSVPVPGGEPPGWVLALPATLPVEALMLEGAQRATPGAVHAWRARGWRHVGWRGAGGAEAPRTAILLGEPATAVRARVLRVDLARAGERDADVRATVRVEPLWLLVRTRVAGTHRLVRRHVTEQADLLSQFEPGSPVMRAAPRAGDPARSAREELLALGTPEVDRDTVLASWAVDLPDARPDLARLTVPPAILAEADGELRRLVLVTADRILPALSGEVFGEPVAAERRVEPVPREDEPDRAEAVIELDVPAGAVRELELVAARRAFDLRVSVSADRPTPPGARPLAPAQSRASWSCDTNGALPYCVAHVELGPRFPWSTREVRLVLEGGDGALPPSLRVRAWHEDPVLLFAPPARGDVRLALLDRAIPESSLRAAPAYAFDVPVARVDPASRRTPPPAYPKGLVLFVALVVVGAIVAWIVRRNLPAHGG
ncbi:MAG: DUF3999 family protein [Acidobacteria bacterium]|nr:MAG: DUF3999 family protein [Acidobacteriota bacterium]